MRTADTVQLALSMSISCQVAPRTSPDRPAVRIRNSSAIAPTLFWFRSAALKVGTSCQGMEAWGSTGAILLRGGRIICGWLCLRAAFGPWHQPRAMAAASTVSMRPRTRTAVSGFTCQIGLSARST
jgi:hypothetical protein